MVISYLPQHIRIIANKSSDGFSTLFLLLGATGSASSFFNMIVLQWSNIECCKYLVRHLLFSWSQADISYPVRGPVLRKRAGRSPSRPPMALLQPHIRLVPRLLSPSSAIRQGIAVSRQLINTVMVQEAETKLGILRRVGRVRS